MRWRTGSGCWLWGEVPNRARKGFHVCRHNWTFVVLAFARKGFRVNHQNRTFVVLAVSWFNREKTSRKSPYLSHRFKRWTEHDAFHVCRLNWTFVVFAISRKEFRVCRQNWTSVILAVLWFNRKKSSRMNPYLFHRFKRSTEHDACAICDCVCFSSLPTNLLAQGYLRQSPIGRPLANSR